MDRDVAPLAHDVYRAIARYSDHPRDRTCRGGVELIRHFPHLEIGFLHHLVGQCRPSQDPEQYPIELCPGGGIKAFECSFIAPGNGAQQPNELGLHQHDRPGPGNWASISPTDRAGPASIRPGRTAAVAAASLPSSVVLRRPRILSPWKGGSVESETGLFRLPGRGARLRANDRV